MLRSACGVARFAVSQSRRCCFGCQSVTVRSVPRSINATLSNVRQYTTAPGITPSYECPVKISSAEAHPDHVLVTWEDGQTSRYHSKWLRHNCQCPVCLEPHSRQRLVCMVSDMWGSESGSLLPTVSQSESSDDSGVTVRWPNGHESVYSNDFLRGSMCDVSIDAKMADSGGKRNLQSFEDIPKLDFDSVLSDDFILLQWLSHLRNSGVALVSGAPLGTEPMQVAGKKTGGGSLAPDFEDEERALLSPVAQLGARIAQPRSSIFGSVWRVMVRGDPQNIAFTSSSLSAHSDLQYYTSPPGIQLLHFARVQCRGGASFFIDAVDAAERLREKDLLSFVRLCRIPMTFHSRPSHQNHWIYTQKPMIELSVRRGVESRDAESVPGASADDAEWIDWAQGREITGVNYAPPFEGPLRASFNDTAAFYDAYASLQTVLHSETPVCTAIIPEGHIATFDNRRMLHGREEFFLESPTDQRELQGTYIDTEDFQSKLRVLRSRYEPSDENLGGFLI